MAHLFQFAYHWDVLTAAELITETRNRLPSKLPTGKRTHLDYGEEGLKYELHIRERLLCAM